MKNAIRRARSRGDRAAVRELRQQLRGLPSGDPRDPGFRRLRYARYADDHLLGFAGPKAEAEEIKARLAQFLRDDLKLELNQEKTLITHARSGAARFLSYEITVQHSRDRPQVNGIIRLRVPAAVIKAKCAPYLAHGQPERRTELMNLTDLLIISTYGAEYRGIVQYYLLAGDVFAAEPAGMGRLDLHAQDAGRQARLDGDENGPQAQGQDRHTTRAAHLL